MYKVTRDGVTLVAGIPSNGLAYVWNDMPANFIYAVNLIPTSPVTSTAEVITYAMDSGAPKQVAKVADVEIGQNAQYGTAITGMFASPQHLVISLIATGPQYPYNTAHLYHKEAGGTLKFMCDMTFLANPQYVSSSVSNITSIRIDANEIYAYIDYVDYNAIPVTAIYDISTAACKPVGQISQ